MSVEISVPRELLLLFLESGLRKRISLPSRTRTGGWIGPSFRFRQPRFFRFWRPPSPTPPSLELWFGFFRFRVFPPAFPRVIRTQVFLSPSLHVIKKILIPGLPRVFYFFILLSIEVSSFFFSILPVKKARPDFFLLEKNLFFSLFFFCFLLPHITPLVPSKFFSYFLSLDFTGTIVPQNHPLREVPFDSS